MSFERSSAVLQCRLWAAGEVRLSACVQAKRETLKIMVYTGLEKSAATQDGVYLQLTGTHGKSRMLSLNVSPRSLSTI
jgi:hypothetical protein